MANAPTGRYRFISLAFGARALWYHSTERLFAISGAYVNQSSVLISIIDINTLQIQIQRGKNRLNCAVVVKSPVRNKNLSELIPPLRPQQYAHSFSSIERATCDPRVWASRKVIDRSRRTLPHRETPNACFASTRTAEKMREMMRFWKQVDKSGTQITANKPPDDDWKSDTIGDSTEFQMTYLLQICLI